MVFRRSAGCTGAGELRPGVLDGVEHMGVHLVVLLSWGEVAEEVRQLGEHAGAAVARETRVKR